MKRHALVVSLCLSLLPAQALAQKSELERAKASFRAGAAAYAAGDYVAAIQALDAAYKLTPLPAIAFSLGQAHRKQYFVAREQKDLERAVLLFRRYIEQVPSGGRRADALEALSQLEPLALASSQTPDESADQSDAVRRTRLMIVSEAPGARISVDGAAPAASPLIREVTAGSHRARVEAPGFFPEEREVTAIAGELILSEIQLAERPSTLRIWSASGSELYIDGTYVGPGGEQVVLRLPSGTHQLAVAQKGRRVAYQTLVFERGKSQNLRVTLEPTRQRTIAKGLFIGGAAALGTGIVLSSLAIRAENEAQSFIGQKSVRNVDEEERLLYSAAITDRNRYRVGAAAAMAASLGFVITGLFLYELDEPDPQEIERKARTPRSDRPLRRESSTSRLRMAPIMTGGNFGAFIQGAF